MNENDMREIIAAYKKEHNKRNIDEYSETKEESRDSFDVRRIESFLKKKSKGEQISNLELNDAVCSYRHLREKYGK